MGQHSQPVPKNSSNFAADFQKGGPLNLFINRESFGGLDIRRVRTHYQSQAQNFCIMATKIDFTAIDRMFAAQLSLNESKETIEALRPRAEEAVVELIRQRGLPRDFTGTLPYNGFQIVVRRPKSFTWELNNQIQDTNLDHYKALHQMYTQLNDDLKELRADMKRTGEKLAKAHPNSESIKFGFTIAVMEAAGEKEKAIKEK